MQEREPAITLERDLTADEIRELMDRPGCTGPVARLIATGAQIAAIMRGDMATILTYTFNEENEDHQ